MQHEDWKRLYNEHAAIPKAPGPKFVEAAPPSTEFSARMSQLEADRFAELKVARWQLRMAEKRHDCHEVIRLRVLVEQLEYAE